MNPIRSAWREPMVWMLVGLPLASVAIGFALLFAAVHPGREDMEIVGETTRVGKLLVAAKDEPSATVDTMGLVLRTKGDMIEAVPVDGNFPRGGKLKLLLSSPGESAPARTFVLSPSELGWRGVGSLDGSDWHVDLHPDNDAWTLHGEWKVQARSIRLVP
ncbi:hypothetical protein [Dyella sp. C11]|uniref:hypothetical protein n=1 Tax=Dyella sp. C11 TaxID=2126991 RepID=UPI0013002ADE|nr:hypothetical protein [Dyella sp. C11]